MQDLFKYFSTFYHFFSLFSRARAKNVKGSLKTRREY